MVINHSQSFPNGWFTIVYSHMIWYHKDVYSFRSSKNTTHKKNTYCILLAWCSWSNWTVPTSESSPCFIRPQLAYNSASNAIHHPPRTQTWAGNGKRDLLPLFSLLYQKLESVWICRIRGDIIGTVHSRHQIAVPQFLEFFVQVAAQCDRHPTSSRAQDWTDFRH